MLCVVVHECSWFSPRYVCGTILVVYIYIFTFELCSPLPLSHNLHIPTIPGSHHCVHHTLRIE